MDMFIAILWIIMFLSFLATMGGFVLLFIFHLTKTDTKTLKKIIISTGITCWASLIISMVLIFCTAEPLEYDTVKNVSTQHEVDVTPTPKTKKQPTETPTPISTNTPTPTPYVETESEYKETCQSYSYKEILRDPESYKGKRIKIMLEISSVHEETFFSDKYYFAYSESEYGFYGDRYAVYDKRSDGIKLLEDDIIYVYGEIDGTVHTSSLIVKSEELVSINMKYVELLSQ